MGKCFRGLLAGAVLGYAYRAMDERILRVLRQAPGVFYCQRCLGRRAQIPRHELDNVWADLVTDRTIEVAEGACGECLAVRMVVRAKPARPG